ncbi:hypothetical protein ACFWMG_09680, partial [Streptomyces sp. NPDC127074]|uniref:hypothetical protein n=1 Tax=Streptomyces sp. NPDC127074 TaxID=3347130 RepID=UPI003651C185
MARSNTRSVAAPFVPDGVSERAGKMSMRPRPTRPVRLDDLRRLLPWVGGGGGGAGAPRGRATRPRRVSRC